MSYEHVIQRAKERLNLNLSEFDCDYIAQMIRDGESEPLSNNWHAIKYHNRIFKVVYNKRKKQVSTVLPIS